MRKNASQVGGADLSYQFEQNECVFEVVTIKGLVCVYCDLESNLNTDFKFPLVLGMASDYLK